MAFVVIEIEVPAQGIPSLNDRSQSPTKPNDAVNLLCNLLDGIKGGTIDASVQVTTRDVTASVTTSGTGSTQYSYNLK